MSSLGYFLRLAIHNLRRGGQRVLVAILCIAFGVMSLVGMTLVSQSYTGAVVLKPSEQLGADLSLERNDEPTIGADQVAELKAMQQSGKLQRFTLISYTSSLAFREAGSGEMHFIAAGMGIDPVVYPLAGRLALSEPGNVGAATLLQAPGDVIVTRDLAQENNLHVGDAIVLTDFQVGAPVQGRVRGIAQDTPNHQGSKIYYNVETADLLAGGVSSANTVLANSSDPAGAGEALSAAGWQVYQARDFAQNNQQAQDLLDMLLKGAGILGLMVGGIGVANTMQVLLRRRQREVAIWKAMGYTELQLQGLFVIEAALLGGLGSLLGAGLGYAISYNLLVLFSRTGNLLVSYHFSPFVILSSVLVGILTTVIFALWAIVAISQAQPAALLRDEPVKAGKIPRLKSIGLALLLAVPFTAVTSLVMGSLLKGIGVLLFALTGLAVLGGFLIGMTWIALRLLPLGRLPLANMAQKSLRRRGFGLVFAMIALFTGIVALSLGVMVIENAQSSMSKKAIHVENGNLQVIAPAGQDTEIRQAIGQVFSSQAPQNINTSYQAAVRSIQTSQGENLSMSPTLIGLSQPEGYQLDQNVVWDSQSEGVYVPNYDAGLAGSEVVITFQDGHTRNLPVAGSYNITWSPERLPLTPGLLMPADLLGGLAQPDQVTYFLQVPAARLDALCASLANALPNATVINLQDYADRYVQTYHNLFVLALSMSGLALLAGVLLVANSVSLAMLDRRYEIGVLKSTGYSRAHVLTILAVEYSLVAAITTCAALIAVQLLLMAIGVMNHLAATLLVLSPQATLLIACLGLSLVFVTVLVVTWGPTRVSPVFVLNERA